MNMNNRLIIALLLCAACTVATAQDDGGKTLKEVVVNGARVVNKADGQTIYPTAEQKEAATSGYALLHSMALPELRVDVTTRTITALSNRGAVQVRINGIVADANALIALDCRAVERIEYIDRPGVRYGDGTGYVINIITRRATGGFSVGADLTNCLTSEGGTNNLFGRANKGKSQWEAAYSIGYSDTGGDRMEETAVYTMPDGATRTRERSDLSGSIRSWQHNATLTYNRADSDRYVLQAKVGCLLSDMPKNNETSLIAIDGDAYQSLRSSTDRSLSPSADIYWQTQAGRHQSLTANAVLTAFFTDYDYSDNDGGSYMYNVDGRAWSLTGEAIYENRLRPFTLSAGAQYRHKHIDNDYKGDVSVRNRSTTRNIYVFGQLSGTIWDIGYTAGMGIGYVSFRQTGHDYRFLLPRPKLSVSRPLTGRLKLAYDFEMSLRISAIANTNAVTLRRNTLEVERGNADLRPTRVTEHTLRLSYADPHVSGRAEVYYRQNDRPNLMKYIRETDDDGHTVFVYTQQNQPGCDMLAGTLYANWQVIPKCLNIAAYGGVYRFFNVGDDYRHYHTSFNGSLMATAFLGPFTLTGYIDNGWNFMEGELRGRQGSYSVVSAQYRHGNVSLSLHWQRPLLNESRSYHGEILSRYVHKDTSLYSRDDTNRLSINLTWTLNRGRKYADIERTMNHRDTDAGVMK